jgi:hypothetical protein
VRISARKTAVAIGAGLIGVAVIVVQVATPGAKPTTVDAATAGCEPATVEPSAAANDKATSHQKAAVSRRLDERYTRYSATNRTGQLEHGFLGVVPDAPAHLSVYVDPQLVDRAELGDDLTRAAAAARAQDRTGAAALSIDVLPSCFTAAEILEAQNVIEARDFSPRAQQVPIQWHLEPRDSRFHVELRFEDRDVADDLVRRLGDRVLIGHDVPVSSPAA